MFVFSLDVFFYFVFFLLSFVKKNIFSVFGQMFSVFGLMFVDGNCLFQSSFKLRYFVNVGDSYDNDRQVGGNGGVQQLDFEGIQRMFNLMFYFDYVLQENMFVGMNYIFFLMFEDF